MIKPSQKLSDILITGAVLGGLYLAYKAYSAAADAAAAVGQATTATGNWVGGTLFDWFNPGAAGQTVTYIVAFPDGANHAINPASVDAVGNFSYAGSSWTLKLDSSGRKVAIPS